MLPWADGHTASSTVDFVGAKCERKTKVKRMRNQKPTERRSLAPCDPVLPEVPPVGRKRPTVEETSDPLKYFSWKDHHETNDNYAKSVTPFEFKQHGERRKEDDVIKKCSKTEKVTEENVFATKNIPSTVHISSEDKSYIKEVCPDCVSVAVAALLVGGDAIGVEKCYGLNISADAVCNSCSRICLRHLKIGTRLLCLDCSRRELVVNKEQDGFVKLIQFRCSIIACEYCVRWRGAMADLETHWKSLSCIEDKQRPICKHCENRYHPGLLVSHRASPSCHPVSVSVFENDSLTVGIDTVTTSYDSLEAIWKTVSGQPDFYSSLPILISGSEFWRRSITRAVRSKRIRSGVVLELESEMSKARFIVRRFLFKGIRRLTLNSSIHQSAETFRADESLVTRRFAQRSHRTRLYYTERSGLAELRTRHDVYVNSSMSVVSMSANCVEILVVGGRRRRRRAVTSETLHMMLSGRGDQRHWSVRHVAQMNEGREAPMMARLPSGGILVIGGLDRLGVSMPSYETWDSQSAVWEIKPISLLGPAIGVACCRPDDLESVRSSSPPQELDHVVFIVDRSPIKIRKEGIKAALRALWSQEETDMLWQEHRSMFNLQLVNDDELEYGEREDLQRLATEVRWMLDNRLLVVEGGTRVEVIGIDFLSGFGLVLIGMALGLDRPQSVSLIVMKGDVLMSCLRRCTDIMTCEIILSHFRSKFLVADTEGCYLVRQFLLG